MCILLNKIHTNFYDYSESVLKLLIPNVTVHPIQHLAFTAVILTRSVTSSQLTSEEVRSSFGLLKISFGWCGENFI